MHTNTENPAEIAGVPTDMAGVFRYRKGPVPLREKGGEDDTKW